MRLITKFTNITTPSVIVREDIGTMSEESFCVYESCVIGTTVVEVLLWPIVSFFLTSKVFEDSMILLVEFLKQLLIVCYVS